MSTIPSTIRTVAVRCDKCHRSKLLIDDPKTLSHMGKCTITSGCTGDLFMIINRSEAKQAQTIPPPITGLDDWVEKKRLYNFTQPYSSKEWTITHNMGTYPTVFAYDKLLNQITPDDISVVDANVIKLKFKQPISGTAQLVSTGSRVQVDDTIGVELNLQQITTSGELTLATLTSTDEISLIIEFEDIVTNSVTEANYDDIGGVGLRSPWVNALDVVIMGQYYKVRSFNLRHDPITTSLINSGRIANGSSVTIRIDTTIPRENVCLLSRPPFTTVDKINNQYVDLFNSVGSIVYSNGELYIDHESPNMKDVYPPILPSTKQV